jgi:hypothetical protein
MLAETASHEAAKVRTIMSLRIWFWAPWEFFWGQPLADNLQSTEIRAKNVQIREEVIYSETGGTRFSGVSYRMAV